MNVDVALGENRYRLNLGAPHDISISLNFEDAHPTAFGIAPASAQPLLTVKNGGSVNCHTVTLTPHGNVTHTECVGHIQPSPTAVVDVLREPLIPATLITLAPKVLRREGRDFPEPTLTEGRFRAALADADPAFLRALIVRTLPNDSVKRTMAWSGTNPPYVEPSAMQMLISKGVEHLLLDVPSADPEQDEGRLEAHRAFWDGGPLRTITELIYVPNEIPDGVYMLSLQLAPFALDATPSRPLLFEVAAC